MKAYYSSLDRAGSSILPIAMLCTELWKAGSTRSQSAKIISAAAATRTDPATRAEIDDALCAVMPQECTDFNTKFAPL